MAHDGADLYWLADDSGARLTPDCRDSSVPFAQALRLVKDGSDPGRLTVWARLANGDAYPLASGVILMEMARSSAGLPRESESSATRPRARRA